MKVLVIVALLAVVRALALAAVPGVVAGQTSTSQQLYAAQRLSELEAVGGVGRTSVPMLITQPVDHFNSSDTRVWQQRYWMSAEPFQLGARAPIFFHAGPENALGDWTVWEGVLVQTTWAIQLRGVSIASEHRYFGESLPFGNESFTPTNLHYLTVENTLADYAAIVQHVRELFGAVSGQNPVVCSGGSYGGFLSWALRALHPEAVDAAVASGAPTKLLGLVDNDTWYE